MGTRKSLKNNEKATMVDKKLLVLIRIRVGSFVRPLGPLERHF